jgi:hypothetical protein
MADPRGPGGTGRSEPHQSTGKHAHLNSPVDTVKIAAVAAALATLTGIGIVRMSGFVDLELFVS